MCALRSFLSWPRVGQRLALLCLPAFLLLTGCPSNDEITTYTAPYEAVSETIEPDAREPVEAGERILALVGEPPDGSQDWWFFKLHGRPEAVGRRYLDMVLFATSLKLPVKPEDEPQYVLPTAWTKTKSKKKFSLYAFQTGHRYTPLPVEVSKVGGDLLENLNRWRELQLGLPKWTQADLDKYLKPDPKMPLDKPELKLVPVPEGAKKIYLVDLTGPGGKDDMMGKRPFAK